MPAPEPISSVDFVVNGSAEYQPYVNYLGPGMVQQGDLTDPYYFDFISFAQYLAMNREISNNPPFVFEEKQPRDVGEGLPYEFVPVVVRRDPSLSNDRLAPEHSRRVGAAVLRYIDETLGSTGAGLPKFSLGQRRPSPGTHRTQPRTTCELGSLHRNSRHQRITASTRLDCHSADQVNVSFSQLVKIFIINGFAWDGDSQLVSTDMNGSCEFLLSLGTPATLWGSHCLRQQRAPLTNQFLYVLSFTRTPLLVTQRLTRGVLAVARRRRFSPSS
jgi:hypothetical protein